jgi:putative acyl-CoA dehydrogenase
MTAPVRLDESDIFNQSPPYEDVNLFATDLALQQAVEAFGAAKDAAALGAFGRYWGSAERFEEARLANENVPKLKTFDAKGFRRDVVEFHPAYHALMARSMAEGIHCSMWRPDGTHAGGEVSRAARFYITNQVEAGHNCPITMTRASVAPLALEDALVRWFVPKILSRSYDKSFRPWWEKEGVTLGMGMTERQGGTDVRANTTRAVPVGDGYEITGHKWFMSAPMCDAFLVLAQAEGGLTCFLMPRFRPDGSVNALRFQRLKDKLGNRSNASSEVEFARAFAWRVGEEGRGVRTIIEMVQLTRLDCAIASAAFMRFALAQALHHARHRRVFQRKLVDQPLMRRVLADLALGAEGALALVMRLCQAVDRASRDPRQAVMARLLIPAAKYLACKAAPGFIYEALECVGGNGYVEEGPFARLYREAPLNAIWEGSGNVMCLDVLRALSREGGAASEVVFELKQTVADLPGAAETARAVERNLSAGDIEANARGAVERLATLATAAALCEMRSPVAEVFARTRLAQPRGLLYGGVELSSTETEQLLDRALPA